MQNVFLDSFTSHGISDLDQIESTVLESMGLGRGIRLRLLRALSERQSMLCRSAASPQDRDASPEQSTAMDLTEQVGNGGVMGPPPAPQKPQPALDAQDCALSSHLSHRPSPNSTSSLYIASTIAHPDMAQERACRRHTHAPHTP